MEQSATVVRLIGGDATPEAIRIVERLGIDPGSRVVRKALEEINGMSAHKLELFAIACLVAFS